MMSFTKIRKTGRETNEKQEQKYSLVWDISDLKWLLDIEAEMQSKQFIWSQEPREEVRS